MMTRLSPVCSQTSTHDQCEQLLVEQLPMITRLLASVARRRRLSPDDAEEFAASALLRVIADDYAVLRKFRGHCSLRTYLTVVFQRMCLDFRRAKWGKWRHSAASRQNGEVAILLEQLTMRDGLTLDEASAVLNVNHGVTLDRDTLARIHMSFVARSRPRFVCDSALEDIAAEKGSADQGVLDAVHLGVLTAAIDRLGAALGELNSQDRLLLKLRFADGMAVADIARLLHLNQKWLYRHFDRLFGVLRCRLESHGVDGGEVMATVGTATLDLPHVFRVSAGDHGAGVKAQGKAA